LANGAFRHAGTRVGTALLTISATERMRPRWRGYGVYFARQVDVVYVLLHGGDKNLNSGTLCRQKRFGPKSGGALNMIELREFDAADYLDDDQTIAAFLADAAKDENPDVFLSALSAVARKRGISEIASKTGLGRTSLYKALAPGANPSYHTLRKVMSALGIPFDSFTPQRSQEAIHL
jgi:probable addiction module antidote protein